jgi:hypothetical protein
METEATQAELIIMAVMVGGTVLCGIGFIVLSLPIWWRGLWEMVSDMRSLYTDT